MIEAGEPVTFPGRRPPSRRLGVPPVSHHGAGGTSLGRSRSPPRDRTGTRLAASDALGSVTEQSLQADLGNANDRIRHSNGSHLARRLGPSQDSAIGRTASSLLDQLE